LTEQRATIVADPSLEYTTVLRAIQKSGKKIISGEADGVSMSIEVEE
jgi:copper chaperone